MSGAALGMPFPAGDGETCLELYPAVCQGSPRGAEHVVLAAAGFSGYGMAGWGGG